MVLIISGCSGFLTPSVDQAKDIKTSINTVEDLNSLMNGIYDILTGTDFYGRSFIINGEVRTANAFSTGHSGRYIEQSKLLYTPADVGGLWEDAYQAIANANIIIHSKIPDSPQVDYIKGQAHAIRAMVSMDLLVRYGEMYVNESDLGIPYITTYNKGNFFPNRSTVTENLKKIENDYEVAISMMSSTLDGSKTTLTYYGVRALQSRFYLTIGNYTKASTAAKDVIKSGKYGLISADNYVESWGTDENKGSIFELAESISGHTNGLATIMQNTQLGDIQVTPDLYNLYALQDVRRDLITAIKGTGGRIKNGLTIYRMTGKYPDRQGTDNIRVIRYAEVVLTYAEAEAKSGNPGIAKTYLDKITSHRNVPDYSTPSIANIRLERRKELAMEGLRFRDLMRTGKGIKRVLPLRHNFDVSVPFGSYRLAYPIPIHEINANPSIEQNVGY